MGESMKPLNYWEAVEDGGAGHTELTQVDRDVVMRCWNYDDEHGLMVGPPTLLRIPDAYLKRDDKGQLEVIARTEVRFVEQEDGG